MQPTSADRERFDVLYRTYARRVHAYVRRHVDAHQVEEVVAETFLTAWRRRDRIDHDEPLPWLLVTARHVVANTRRRSARGRTEHRDLHAVAASVPAVDGPVVERDAALAALSALSDTEREAVLLVAWDGLDNRAAAAVAGCSVRAFTVRLHRARLRLARQFAPDADPPPAARPVPRAASPRAASPRAAALGRIDTPRLIEETR